MRLQRALQFPLRKPLRLVSLALVQSLFLWELLGAIDKGDRFPSNLESIAIITIFFACPIINALWLHGYAVASLRHVFAGQGSLPRLRTAHVLPQGIGPFLSSLITFFYFLIFGAGILGLPSVLRPYLFAPDGIAFGEAINQLTTDAPAVVLFILITLIYFIGIARYAAVGGGRTLAALKTNVCLLLTNRSATIRYLLQTFLLLGIAALVLNVGSHLGHAIAPRGLGVPFDDMRATAWSALAIFVYLCGFMIFWQASLYLLADYAVTAGITETPLNRGGDK